MPTVTFRIGIILTLPVAAIYGQTAEIPKRTIYDSSMQTTKAAANTDTAAAEAAKSNATAEPASVRGASSRALDTLSSSNEDLNVIRDVNVRRLTTGGCAPEASARIADLAARLQASGVVVDAPRSAGGGGAGSESATLALASNWFKQTSDTASASKGKDQREALLDSVLPGTKSTGSAGQEVASLKTELENLLAACPATKR